jgi:hypothetical protein
MATVSCFLNCNATDYTCIGNCPMAQTTAGQALVDPVLNCWCSMCTSQCSLVQGMGLCK